MKKIIYAFLALFTMASVVPAVSMAGGNDGSKSNLGGFGSTSTNDGDKTREQGFDLNSASFTGGGARGVGGNSNMQGAKLLDSVKKFINWALGMLATVALVLCLWGGFKMMTAGGDDGKYTEGTNILKKAAIGLVVIGGAWMLVSIVMWLIGKVSA